LTISLRSEIRWKMKRPKITPRKRRHKNLPHKIELWETVGLRSH